MSEDRRTSLRRRESLPFAWRPCDSEPGPTEICQALDLPASALGTERLNELEDEIAGAIRSVREPPVADALRLLNQRISLLQEALLGRLPMPENVPIDLSADGLGFTSASPVEPETWIAVHLVLPEGTHLVCAGQVTHCRSGNDGFSVGVRLRLLDKAGSRRLTRHVITNKSQ